MTLRALFYHSLLGNIVMTVSSSKQQQVCSVSLEERLNRNMLARHIQECCTQDHTDQDQVMSKTGACQHQDETKTF